MWYTHIPDRGAVVHCAKCDVALEPLAQVWWDHKKDYILCRPDCKGPKKKVTKK